MDKNAAPDLAPHETALSNDDVLLPLWRIARSYIVFLMESFGGPKDIAAMGAIGPRLRSEILTLLHPIEALLRRLILRDAVLITPDIEAGACDEQGLPLARHDVHGAAFCGAHEKPAPDPEAPHTWRAAFSFCVPRTGVARVVYGAPAPLAPCRHGLFDAWRLARRFEACLRAFNDPEPYARRLARRLAANARATQALLETLSRMPPRYKREDVWRPGRDALRDVCAHLRARTLSMSAPDSS